MGSFKRLFGRENLRLTYDSNGPTFAACRRCRRATYPNLVFQIGIEPVRIDLLTSLAGVTFADPATGAVRVFDELGRRKLDLEGLVCPGAPVLAGTSLRKGIDRVH